MLKLRLVVLLWAILAAALNTDLRRHAGAASGAPWKKVLLLGCSVDRYALIFSYPHHKKMKKKEAFGLDMRVAHDPDRRVSVAYIFHPGVGNTGTMDFPFFVPTEVATIDIIRSRAVEAAKRFLGTPDTVIVDSSLWDLATWTAIGKHSPSTMRIQQWCDHDLRSLLNLVASTFSSSQIVFRTAPQILHDMENKFRADDIERMYNCIRSSISGINGKLYGQYEVLDYHKIMEDLMTEARNNGSSIDSLWRRDGYHPGLLPSVEYMNEIFRRIGAQPLSMQSAGDTARWADQEGADGNLI